MILLQKAVWLYHDHRTAIRLGARTSPNKLEGAEGLRMQSLTAVTKSFIVMPNPPSPQTANGNEVLTIIKVSHLQAS